MGFGMPTALPLGPAGGFVSGGGGLSDIQHVAQQPLGSGEFADPSAGVPSGSGGFEDRAIYEENFVHEAMGSQTFFVDEGELPIQAPILAAPTPLVGSWAQRNGRYMRSPALVVTGGDPSTEASASLDVGVNLAPTGSFSEDGPDAPELSATLSCVNGCGAMLLMPVVAGIDVDDLDGGCDTCSADPAPFRSECSTCNLVICMRCAERFSEHFDLRGEEELAESISGMR
jgi:hypothetical protein